MTGGARRSITFSVKDSINGSNGSMSIQHGQSFVQMREGEYTVEEDQPKQWGLGETLKKWFHLDGWKAMLIGEGSRSSQCTEKFHSSFSRSDLMPLMF